MKSSDEIVIVPYYDFLTNYVSSRENKCNADPFEFRTFDHKCCNLLICSVKISKPKNNKDPFVFRISELDYWKCWIVITFFCISSLFLMWNPRALTMHEYILMITRMPHFISLFVGIHLLSRKVSLYICGFFLQRCLFMQKNKLNILLGTDARDHLYAKASIYLIIFLITSMEWSLVVNSTSL